MVAVLPPAALDASGSLHGGCPLPGAGTLGAITAGLAAGGRVMAISVPKVKLATSASLQDVLTALGMGLAFTGRADFTRLSPQACCIGFVQHAATLAMAEKGTVASAATAVGIQPSAGFVTLRFNRPYLLLLRDSLTGEPLFMAWVANPASI